MAKSRAKVTPHLSLFDWRVSMGIGFLFGVVVSTAPQYIGLILLLGALLGVLRLIEKGRI